MQLSNPPTGGNACTLEFESPCASFKRLNLGGQLTAGKAVYGARQAMWAFSGRKNDQKPITSPARDRDQILLLSHMFHMGADSATKAAMTNGCYRQSGTAMWSQSRNQKEEAGCGQRAELTAAGSRLHDHMALFNARF